MRVNEKFSTSWASSSVNPSGLISKCVFSRTAGYSETIVDEIVPKAYDLDRLFFVKHGEKNLVKWFESIDTSVSQNCLYCSDMVATMYNNKWTRLYDAMVMSLYDPIQNYKMRETEEYEGDDEHTGSDGNSVIHGETITTKYGKLETVTHGDTVTTTYGNTEKTEYGKQVHKYGETENETTHDNDKVQTMYGSQMEHEHGENIETKTLLPLGDTVETEIDSNDPAKTTNKVFGFNSTADSGVMDSISTNTGKSTVTTKKDDKELHDGSDFDKHSGMDTVTYSGKQSVTEKFRNRYDEDDGEDTVSQYGQDSDSHTGQTQTKDSDQDIIEHRGTDTGSNTYNSNMNKTFERELNREGNIGVTSSQQMLEQEIELRKKMFYEIMMQDLCEMFCIPIY